MQKQEAHNIIESTFNASFSEEKFTLFIKNLLNDIDTTRYNEYRGNLIKDAYKDHIRQYKRIGKYTDPNGDALDVLIVEVKDQTKLDKTRTSLRNFVISHLDSFEKDYALVAFYSNSDHGADWRFSFVKLEYKTEVKEGKLKQSKELTPAKRYSFLVGEHEKAHTAKKQLLPLLENVYNNPTLEELEEAFSIEKVTDEFFEQYKALFLGLTEQFDKDQNGLKEQLAAAGIDIPRFTKKLLGQIVFLYFIQKKGWLGVPKNGKWGEGQKKYLQQLYDDAVDNGKNFFGDYLQHLFYEALAHIHNDENIKGYYKTLGCKVPFLNGGLFEADYDWQSSHITIPNHLFRNDEKVNKTGDVGTGVLDVFDRYNFTIKEDEPLEKEVAVDPEMLGKVFENMLEVTERKSKGAFYTPREIVHYMCQESLIHYLDNAVNTYAKTYQQLGDNQTNLFGNGGKKGQQSLMQEKDQIIISKDDIEVFIRKGFFALENDQRILLKGKETSTYTFKLPESIRGHADLLDKKLADIKVCDPAIGSGAFPVGMLHEIVNARLVLRQYLKNQKNHSNQSNHINHSSDNIPDNYAYQLKRHTIQESIYGVDIDASAIDIARLRLWLSLVVDEEDLDNIEALPNLDYKIVCGNSLIGLPENAMYDENIKNELEKLKDDFFNETDDKNKKKLRNQINSKIRVLLDSAEQWCNYKIDFDFKLFFSEVWHYNKGFDIVIGNPPYVEHKKLKAIASTLKPIYEVYTGSSDLSVYFFEKGTKLLKKGGTLTYINTNKFFNTGYGKSLRTFLLKHRINSIINFEQVEIFEKVLVSSVIFNSSKFDAKQDNDFSYVGFYKTRNWRSIFHDKIKNEKQLFHQKTFDSSEWIFADRKELDIKKRIENNSVLIKNISGVQIKRGVTTGYDPAFIIGEDLKNELNDKAIKPLLKGREIKKYKINRNGLYLIFTRRGIDIEKHQSIKTFLLQYKEQLTPRKDSSQKVGRKPGDYKWFEIQDNTAYYKLFERNKIIWALTSDKWGYTIDTQHQYLTSGGFFLVSDNFSLKYIVALLNSSILEYYFNFIGVMTAGGAYTLKKATIEYLPIRLRQNTTEFDILVSYIIFVKELNNILLSSFFEQVIDSAVFELYFPTEIKSVGKEILKHLCDLKPINDSMSDEEKLAIIQSEFERLYDPNHPVRNNVETLDSVEEVRIIREALK